MFHSEIARGGGIDRLTFEKLLFGGYFFGFIWVFEERPLSRKYLRKAIDYVTI